MQTCGRKTFRKPNNIGVCQNEVRNMCLRFLDRKNFNSIVCVENESFGKKSSKKKINIKYNYQNPPKLKGET